MLSGKLKIAAHALLFVVAFVVFYLGLGVGLQYNSNLGTLLWLVAGAIVGLNVYWLFITRDKAGRKGLNDPSSAAGLLSWVPCAPRYVR